jgi:hypothetical protein
LIPGQAVEDHVNEESNFIDVCICGVHHLFSFFKNVDFKISLSFIQILEDTFDRTWLCGYI